MYFEIDVHGISIKLQINDYKPTNKDTKDSDWCKCDFLFTSGD